MASLKPPPKPLLSKKLPPGPKLKAAAATLGTAATSAQPGAAAATGKEAKPAVPASKKLPLPPPKKGLPVKLAEAPAAAAAPQKAELDTKEIQVPAAKAPAADSEKKDVAAGGKMESLKATSGIEKAAPPEAGGPAGKVGGEKEAAAGKEKVPAAPAAALAAKKNGDGKAAAAAAPKTPKLPAGDKAAEAGEKTAAAKGKTAAAATKEEVGKAVSGDGKEGPAKDKGGTLAPRKPGAAAAPRKSLQDLLRKDAPKSAAAGGLDADEPVAVATQQLLQYYDKSQEMLLQQQQYYVDAQKQQLLQQQEQAMMQEPPSDQVAKLRRDAGIKVEDAALIAAIKNVCKREIARRRLREYMLQHHKEKREDLLQGKISAEAVSADLSKKHVKLLNVKEWVALVQEFKAEATALDAALEKLKKEKKEDYEGLMASEFRDAAKLQQQKQVAALLQQLLALPGASFRSTNLVELLIDEIEFAHALKDVRAYLETQPEVLRALVDSAKFLFPSRSSRTTAAAASAAAAATRDQKAAPPGGRGKARSAESTKATEAASASAAAAGVRRMTATGGKSVAPAGRGGSVGGGAGALGSRSIATRGVPVVAKRSAGGIGGAKCPSAESLRVMGEKLFATAVEKLQQQFSQQYRTAALIGAAHALEDLQIKAEPCWLAKLLLPVDPATGIFVHHNVISYLLLFLPPVSYVRLQQCSSLTYKAVETDLNRRIYRLPLQSVPHRTDLSYFYHIVRFFFRDGVRLLPLDRLRYRPTQQALATANQLLPVCPSTLHAQIYVSLDALPHDMISSPDAEQPLPHLWEKSKAKAGTLGKSTSQEISLLQFIEEYKMRAQVRKDDLVWQQPVEGVDVHAVSALLQHLLKTLTATVERHRGHCFFRRTEYLMNNDVQVFHRIWLQCNLRWGGRLEDSASTKRLHFTVADNFRWEG